MCSSGTVAPATASVDFKCSNIGLVFWSWSRSWSFAVVFLALSPGSHVFVVTTSSIPPTTTTTTNHSESESGDFARANVHLDINAFYTSAGIMNDEPASSDRGERPPPVLNQSEICGRRFIQSGAAGRIAGGTGATYGKWPWQISLKIRQPYTSSSFEHHCGAVLLNETFAVTAAHCIQKLSVKFMLLGLGEFNFAENENHLRYKSIKRRVRSATIHQKFDPITFENDLALLQFDKPIVFQPNIVPICLPTAALDDAQSDYLGQNAFVTGWGLVYNEEKTIGKLPFILQEVELPIVPNSECESKVKSNGYKWPMSKDTFICAGQSMGAAMGGTNVAAKSACWGDSGGPMVIQRKKDKRWVLVGVTSFGMVGPCGLNAPTAYTRISAGTLDSEDLSDF